MRFESQTFWLAKDADDPDQYQDALALDAERGVAVIADGVSSAIFSRLWARILTEATVAAPPPIDDPVEFQAWLTCRRATWTEQIDTSRLTWFQRPKMVDGAMSTLLWVELSPIQADNSLPADRYNLRCYSIGDCCLFHVRGGQLLLSFPMQSSAQFGLNPAVIGSIDRKLDQLLQFEQTKIECRAGDLLVLATDAIALWAIHRLENGEGVDWESYWNASGESWRDEIFALRRDNCMRYDDSTLALLRVIEERAAPVIFDLPELCDGGDDWTNSVCDHADLWPPMNAVAEPPPDNAPIVLQEAIEPMPAPEAECDKDRSVPQPAESEPK